MDTNSTPRTDVAYNAQNDASGSAREMISAMLDLARTLERENARLKDALQEFIAAVDGRYLEPSYALGTTTVPNPRAAVKATTAKARAALVQSPS